MELSWGGFRVFAGKISGFHGDFVLLWEDWRGRFRAFARKISGVNGDFGLLWGFRAFMGMISGLLGRRSGFRGEHFGR